MIFDTADIYRRQIQSEWMQVYSTSATVPYKFAQDVKYFFSGAETFIVVRGFSDLRLHVHDNWHLETDYQACYIIN